MLTVRHGCVTHGLTEHLYQNFNFVFFINMSLKIGVFACISN